MDKNHNTYTTSSITRTTRILRILRHTTYTTSTSTSLITRILRQHRVLQNLRKNKDIVITKPDKVNGVVILDHKLYNNAVEEIISDTYKFEKLNENPTLKCEASLQCFLRNLTK